MNDIKLKLLDWCDSLLDSQLSNLKKTIWEIKKGKASLNAARLKIKQERENENDSNSRETSCTTNRDCLH